MSRSGYIWVVNDLFGVLYATDRKYSLRDWWEKYGLPGLSVTRVRWDGDVQKIEMEWLP